MIAKGKRSVAFAAVLCLLLCLLPGCGMESNRAQYVLPETFESVDTQTVASNAEYTLEWDDEYKSVMMHSKSTGKVWGTTPYEFYTEGDTTKYLSSPVIIETIETVNFSSTISYAYDSAISEGYVSARTIDNGIEVTYYFDDQQISVPVQYVLRSDSLAVSIDTTKITEGDEFMLQSVTLAPYMSSVANDTQDSYLFVPAGNGALMSVATDADGKRIFNGEVYGTDGSRYQPYEYYEPERVKMPVFGVKNGNDGLLGIIESGAEQGRIDAEAGNTRTDYSNAAATFYVRGYDIYENLNSELLRLSTRLSKPMVDTTFTVGYYSLSGEDADYMGMAERYRDYLIDNGLTKNEIVQNAYALSIFGNVETDSLAFGVPYTSTKSMTTFNEALDILKELTEATKLTPSVQLLGYGASGLDIGQVAGGFKFAGVSGSNKDYATLTAYAADNGIPLFTDFDLVFFKASGGGFNTMMHVAKTATLHKSELYHRMLALRAQDEDLGLYRVLSRSKLASALEKLLNKGEKLGVTGYSFSTLGSVAYSDYEDEAYYTKKGMASDVKEMFGTVNEAGHAVSSDNANDYAAVSSDSIFNVQVAPRDTFVFDEYVPFYQIVFKGSVPMYSEPLNQTSNYEVNVLRALESGVGLGYSLLKNYDATFAATEHTDLYSSLYTANKQQILDTVAEYQDYYAAIKDAMITDHAVMENGVTVTTFDNGVVAYTNQSDTAKSCAAGELAAYGFTYTQGGTMNDAIQ